MLLNTTLTDRVYEEILRRISQQSYLKGQKLPSEMTLCTEFSASRTVIRSALQRLKAEGYITSLKGVGNFVSKISPNPIIVSPSKIENFQDFLDVMQFRYAVEGHCASLATKNASSADKLNIQRAFERTMHLDEERGYSQFDADLAFHIAVAKASHNSYFRQAIELVQAQILMSMKEISKYFEGNTTNYLINKSREHRMILQAILSGDPTLARNAMEYHLRLTLQYVTPDLRA